MSKIGNLVATFGARYPYEVVSAAQGHAEAVAWCAANCNGDYTPTHALNGFTDQPYKAGHPRTYSFASNADAALFRLFWG
jgi:hypothetical protein